MKHYAGFLYRALNPVYARDPLSSRGAEMYGGRFNPKGTPALYASLSPAAALREANQVGTLQPTTLVAYDADIRPVFDVRDAGALSAFGMTPVDLASAAWRDEMTTRGELETQKFARRLIAEGYAALLVPSFARGAPHNALNLVLWRWTSAPPTKLVLVDDENRLRDSVGEDEDIEAALGEAPMQRFEPSILRGEAAFAGDSDDQERLAVERAERLALAVGAERHEGS